MPKIKKKTVAILIIVAIALYIITEVIPAAINQITPTTTIEHGELVTNDKLDGYILRDETVFVAKENSQIDYKVEEGVQVKVGTKVIEYNKTPQKENNKNKESRYSELVYKIGKEGHKIDINTAPQKGVFSTYVDGYESYFTVGNFKVITEEKAKEYTEKTTDVKNKIKLANDPIYKVTDNSKWYVMSFLDSNKTSRYQIGKSVNIDFEGGSVKFKVENILPYGNDWKILFSTNRYLQDFQTMRKTTIDVKTLSIDAALVPNGCITSKDDVVGVYVVLKTGEYEFRPIKVLGNDGETSAVVDDYFYNKDGQMVKTIDIYDEILKNPKCDKGK